MRYTGRAPPPWRPGERFEQYGPIKVPGVVDKKPGDVVSVEVTGLGTLVNPVVPDEQEERGPAEKTH